MKKNDASEIWAAHIITDRKYDASEMWVAHIITDRQLDGPAIWAAILSSIDDPSSNLISGNFGLYTTHHYSKS